MSMDVQRLIDDALKTIETISAQQAMARLGDPDVVFVDLRDSAELAAGGQIPDAFHMPRGNLEFWIDRQSKYHKPIFASGKRFIFYCAADLRSTLATATAGQMGLERVCHIKGGFQAWQDAGGPVQQKTENPA